MRVDLAEHTLSKEVEDALATIKELKNISEGTRDYIKYSRKYREIMHSKINFQSLEDPRINTLKQIRDWFICGDKQKTESKEWISSQCQFDLVLSINGFIGMLTYILNKYPSAMIQAKRISQDMLEGLFGTIRELGGDSSTQTLKSYGHALNKYQITMLVSSEIKSVNYGKTDSTGTGITTLVRRDYRKDKQKTTNNEENNYIYQKHLVHLAQISSLSHNVFKNLLTDDLIMGKIKFPLGPYHKNVDQENIRIFCLQSERHQLIETILYQDSIDKLLQKWQDIIKNIACKAILKKTGIQWLATWSSYLENCLNNFKCSGVWYQDFLIASNLNDSSTKRLVAYLLLQEVIKITFSEKTVSNISQTHLAADNNLKPEKIIVLESSEASKFSYIIGWIVYKLTKNDNITKSRPEFEAIKTHLMTLNSEQVVYEQDVRSQTTNVIPGLKFLEFMYKIESLVLLLFEKHTEFGPNILQYIHNSLLCNLPLLENFNTLINISTQMLSTCDSINITKYELKDDARDFLYERIIIIYMKSRQKSWRKFNDLIPEKGTSSLRENLKAMRNDTENNIPTLIKKSNLPKDPMLGLVQLQIWVQLDGAEGLFSKLFLVSELQWLLWAFGDNINNKRKKSLIPLILEHLKKGTSFSKEAISKGQIFTV
ncbi:uncharacterized protein OCT59_022869 [Rhizophagus irregularis]|nr:hypothetical protein OCT59_022869 [Rhizophagus irregularis]